MAFDPAKYGATPVTNFDPSKYGATSVAPTPVPEKPNLMGRITGAANAVTDFVGARGIADQFGASLARTMAPKEQKPYIQDPGFKKVLGSALQTGAMLIPGAGVAAKIATKAALGAVTGYGIDVGSKLQQDKPVSEALKPGLATAVGVGLPLLGKITGLSNVGKATQKTASKLEELNMRLTPVEKQNLAKQGKNIADYLSKKKIVGSPAQRYAKVEMLYDDMENLVQEKVTASGVKFPRLGIMRELDELPKQFIDDPELHQEAITNIAKFKAFLTTQHGAEIPAEVINQFKRSLFKRAYSKNSTDVLNEARLVMGGFFKGLLDDAIPGLSKINNEYGIIIAARKALFKATSRNQSGLLGKTGGLVAGTSIGGALAGPGGAAVGAFVGPQAVNAVSTPVRSALGAGLQGLSDVISKTPAAKRGLYQLPRKAFLQALPKE